MDDYTVKSSVGVERCGYALTLYLKIHDDLIMDAKIKSYGCIKNNNINSVVAYKLKGMKISEALKLTNKKILNELYHKENIIHCDILIEQLLKEALKDYSKQR